MVSQQFIHCARALWHRTPGKTWEAICALLLSCEPQETRETLLEKMSFVTNPDLRHLLRHVLSQKDELSWNQVGVALLTLKQATVSSDVMREPEIIWTGPPNGVFPVRRTDQILYDLIRAATSRILLVTFAATQVPILVECLEKAAHRGVELTLILESEAESEGQLSVDALQAFPKAIHDQATIYVWPYSKRALNTRGRPGKLHAKCAVVDDAAIITSANLTDDAFNRNMELGVLIRGGNIPNAIYRQFFSLIEAGVLLKKEQ